MIKVLIAGDFCPIGKIQELSIENKHNLIFNDLLPEFKENDLNVVNLECPLISADKFSKKIGPSLKADPKTINALKYAQINLVTLANNHIMDFGEEGLKATIDLCEANNIDYVGAGYDLNHAKIPFISNIKGKKVGVLNFAENEFSNTQGDYAGSNPLALISNFHDIQKVKKTVDFLIVIVHGGNEMYELPSPRLKETMRFFADVGADAVLAHHSHCFSGFEVYNSKPIFYGLGNFLFDYNRRDNKLWYTGIAVRLKLSNEAVSYEIIPFYQNKDNCDGVHLLNKEDKLDFDKRLGELNEIIEDNERLEYEFLKFVQTKKKMYSHFLQPYTNKFLHKLYGHKLIPSALNEKKRMLYLNLIRCESHRDVILEILKQKSL
jgi:hypothetical protein